MLGVVFSSHGLVLARTLARTDLNPHGLVLARTLDRTDLNPHGL